MSVVVIIGDPVCHIWCEKLSNMALDLQYYVHSVIQKHHSYLMQKATTNCIRYIHTFLFTRTSSDIWHIA